jgi:hypothetical protein
MNENDTLPQSTESDVMDAHLIRHFKNEQNLPLAIGAGAAAAVVCALIWAVVTVATSYQIGWMAVGLGFVVSMAVRMGKGIDPVFRIAGAVLALAGCVLGNALSLVGFIAHQEDLGYFEVLGLLDYAKFPSLMVETSSPMDLLFYGIAIYQGYQFSMRTITQEDLVTARQKGGF